MAWCLPHMLWDFDRSKLKTRLCDLSAEEPLRKLLNLSELQVLYL